VVPADRRSLYSAEGSRSIEMLRAWLIGMTVLATIGCAAPEPTPSPTESLAPTDGTMTRAIEAHERFSEPIFVEVWANGKGPTTDALVSRGLLEPAGKGEVLKLTESGKKLGVREDYFQDNIPIFYVPVGHRELIEVVPVGGSQLKSVTEVSFTYRNAPSKLGAELVASGSRAGELDGQVVRTGRAMLGMIDEGWRISNLQL
jgi:hypothetical protein